MPFAVADPEASAEACKVKVKKALLSKAVKALCQIVSKKSANSNLLFEGSAETVQLQFSLSKVPEKRKTKPFMIPLPHPMYNDKSEVCFICKDPQKKYKDLLIREKPLPGLTKVLGVDKLKRNYREFESKSALADSFDLFMCDIAIADMMPKLLGKMFYKNKRKHPIPVKLKMDDPHPNLERAMNSTPLKIPSGPCLAVKIGRCSMAPNQLEENAAAVISKVVKHMIDNRIMTISIQATDAPALPIWRRAGVAGPLSDLKKHRSDTSSAASETGTSNITSDLENTGSEITSDAGETLSTRDSYSEVASAGGVSEVDTDMESHSGLDSEAGDVDDDDAKASKEDLPLMQGFKKKRKLGNAGAAKSQQAAAKTSDKAKANQKASDKVAAASSGSMAPPPPKKKKTKAT